MDKVKRAVRDASGDIARNAKAANDNLAGIGRGAGAGLKQFSQEAERANEYLRKIAQTSADVETRVNAVTGVTGGMRRSAEDFAAYGKELDRLRAQYNPLFAVIQKYRASVEGIRQAYSVGAISAEEMAEAISRERQASLESIAALKGRTTAIKEAEQAARAAAQAEEEAARQRAAAVASADSYAAKLQAEASAIGKTATELRDMEVAQRAAAAAAAGMPDQAERIRAAGAALSEAEARARAYAEEQKRTADAARAAADAEAEYAKSIEDLKKQANPAGTAQAQLNAQMDLAEKAFREGRLAADDYAKIIHNLQTRVNLLNTEGFGPLGHGGQVAGHHMLNLSFQMQDLGIQMLGAAQSSAPLKLAFTALAQQGSQIYGVIQQSGLGVKAFAAEALVAAGIIKTSGDEAMIAAARQAAAHEAVVASLAERAAANVATADAEVALARTQVANASTATEAAAAHARLVAAEEASTAAAVEATTAQGALARAQAASAAATEAASASMATGLGSVGAVLLPLAAAAAVLAGGIGLVTSEINKNSKVSVSWSDTLLGAWDALVSYLQDGLAAAFDAFGIKTSDVWKTVLGWTKWAVNRIIGLTSVVPRALMDTWKLIPSGVADIFISATNYAIDAMNGLIKKAVDLINGYVNQANTILDKVGLHIGALDTPHIDKLENSYAGAGAKLGNALVKSLSDTMQRDFVGEFADAISPFAQKRAIARAKKDAEKAGKATGAAVAKATKEAFNIDDFIKESGAKLAALAAKQAQASADSEWAEFQREVDNMGQFYFDERMDNLKREQDAAAALEDQYRDLINTLGNLGGAGAGIATLLGLVTGNSTSIGGKLGNLLNVGMGFETDDQGQTVVDKQGRAIAKTIGTELTKVFKKGGEFATTLTKTLQSAGLGVAASSAIFGKQSSTEQLGSAIGGALGGKAGDILGKTLAKSSSKLLQGLGDFAGPLGSIVGGVVGNVLGGMLTKVKWGRVTLTSEGVSSTSGNSGSSEKAALAAGNSIYGSLTDLAKQFGGIIGDFGSIAVGVRHGDYRVNANGTSLKVKKGAVDFNDDAEAAVAYAMKLAIERGAINGIRQSTNNLLKSGDDLSAQIDKALSFEGVFTDLKTYLDPVGAELDSIDKEFANLRSIFAEAGATAEEYAQLEQLLSIKRQEAMNKETDALNDIKSRIAEAQGDDATVTAIARAKELRDATSDAQRALLQQLYAIEDANAAQEALTAAQEEAATAAQQLQQAWESVGDSILDEVNRIRGLSGGDDAASFATLQGQFNAAIAAARAGDQDAASKLVDLSQSLLDAAGNTATSRQELERIKAETAAKLEGVYDAIPGLTGSSSSSASATVDSASAAATGSTSTSTSSTTDVGAAIISLTDKVEQMRSEMNSGNAAIVSGVNRSAKVLENVSPSGDAINVANG
ncbi:hypothetical protein [Novosphingobium sp. BL-8A]|uniref:hypothetical protein n=1 Tax=Novosphingobium sp. BL-8A TaxID=3127639 RepID=UPI003756A0AD